MPVLRQRKDGDFYVRAWVPSVSSVATWQLTRRGLDILQRQGCSADGDTFSDRLLQQLKEQGDAFTYGSGLTPASVKPEALIMRDKAVSNRQLHTSMLMFDRRETGWRVALRIDEIPRRWCDTVYDLVDALSGWCIVIDDAHSIPAMRLYPGRSGAIVDVPPKTGFYTLTIQGKWPKQWDWDVRRRFIGTPGLTPVTVFDADTSERRRGEPLEPGERYVLVVQNDHLAPPPDDLQPIDLGFVDQWRAWDIQVPATETLSDRSKRWCEHAGLQLAERRFRLALVTPPYACTDDGRPVVVRDEDIICALTPIGEPSPTEPTFYVLRCAETGSFRITIDDLPAAPLRIEVSDRQTLPCPQPPEPLLVAIDWGDGTHHFRALSSAGEPQQLTPPSCALRLQPHVQVVAQGRVDLVMTIGDCSERFAGLIAEEAAERLAAVVEEAICRSHSLTILIDAGPFGRLTLALPAAAAQTSPAALTPAMLRRARWLAAELLSLNGRAPVVPLNSALRPALNTLAERTGRRLLANRRTMPAELLPAVWALARAITRKEKKTKDGRR